LALSAQTFTEDISGTPPVNTFARVDGLPVGSILFNNVEGGAIANPYEINPVGATITEVTTASGTFTAFDICSEMFVGPNGSSSYDLTEGLGALSGAQQVLVVKLFSNTLVDFFTKYNSAAPGDRDEAAKIGAAIQLVFWEIAEDPAALTTPNLVDNTPTSGELSIDGFDTSYTGITKDSVDLAQTYISNLSTWTDQGGVYFYSADPGSDQDRLWVTSQAIPEPSSTLFGLLSLGFLHRRKRA
jgi:hypothetical protein